MAYKDPQKQREYQREWIKQNNKQTSYLKRKQMVRDAKSKPCQSCSKSYDPVCMDLHHIDPIIKDGMIAKFVRNASYDKLQEEIDKCMVLCAPCHRMYHAGLLSFLK
jgi:hypothetical protein